MSCRTAGIAAEAPLAMITCEAIGGRTCGAPKIKATDNAVVKPD